VQPGPHSPELLQRIYSSVIASAATSDSLPIDITPTDFKKKLKCVSWVVPGVAKSLDSVLSSPDAIFLNTTANRSKDIRMNRREGVMEGKQSRVTAGTIMGTSEDFIL
jgi:hypothetical protein